MLSMTRPVSKFLFVALFGLGLWWALTPQPVYAQSGSCDAVIASLNTAISPNICQQVAAGNACYGSTQVDSQLVTGKGPFNSPGRQVKITDLKSMTTRAPRGAALMVANTATGDVKIIAYGDVGLTPVSGQSFVMRKQGARLVCERTAPGLVLQTPSGKKGTVTVNGVQIKLGSTVFVGAEGDLLFDQDPRIDRRQGSANPSAPLCSGFDSDCDFGDRSCAVNSRVVWGPYCGENRYDYIRKGLYRISLYGAGRVRAGATDYEPARKQFSLEQVDFTLSPTNASTYTFCWEGQQSGSTGWETVVTALGAGASVDRLTVEYLGDNCATAGNAAASSGAGVMTVTNVDGSVEVSALGEVMRPAPGEKVRVGMAGTRPVWIDEPRTGITIIESPVVQWLTFDPDGLPDVNTEGSEPSDSEGPAISDVSTSPAITGDVWDICPYNDFSVTSQITDPSGVASATFYYRITSFGTQSDWFSVNMDNDDDTYFAYLTGIDGDSIEFTVGAVDALGNYSYSDYRSAAIALCDDGGGTSDGPPSSADNEGPVITNVDTDPVITDGFLDLCSSSNLSVYSQIADPAGVAGATVWYQLRTDDSYSEWESVAMSSDGDFYYATLPEIDSDSIEFVVFAEDELGNVSQTEYRTADIIGCDYIG